MSVESREIKLESVMFFFFFFNLSYSVILTLYTNFLVLRKGCFDPEQL